MPIYMDFHDLPDGVTAAHVAEMHQADLKIEHKYNCRGLTYWCDEKRQTAFCLIEAPNEQAIIDLHQKAHGGVPQRVIEVNDTIVESFLGRIEDPEKSKNERLNIINDPAFRTLMVVYLKKIKLRNKDHETLAAALRGYNKSITNIVGRNNGRVVKSESGTYLMSFNSVSNAIKSALKIEEIYNCVITPDLQFQIGISAGVPVTDKEGIFEDTINKAGYLAYVSRKMIAISKDVNDLYESENRQNELHAIGSFRVYGPAKEDFLFRLMEFLETRGLDPSISVRDFQNSMGYGKSKLYRTMIDVTGYAPNEFVNKYRLTKALELLNDGGLNISEIAYQTGYNSPSYFTRCFQKEYGVLPSKYSKLQLS